MNPSFLDNLMADALGPFSFRREPCKTGLMGIVNVTPDSFHQSSRRESVAEAIHRRDYGSETRCRLQFEYDLCHDGHALWHRQVNQKIAEVY